jgi:hypothetical protein
MKITYHIPTEQYGFVEVEAECNDVASNDSYEDVKRAISIQTKVGMGMDDTTFNKCLDKYLAGGGLLSEEYEVMDGKQQWCIQQIKKANKRKQ